MWYKLKRIMMRPNGTEQKIRPAWWKPWVNTLLYVPMDTDLLDHSWNNVSITNYNIALNTSLLQNIGVWYFRWSSEDRLEFSWIQFRTNDFTISWWENTSQSNYGVRFSSAWTSSNTWAWLLLGYAGNLIYVWTWWIRWDIIEWRVAFSSTVNTWVHWVITREWSSWKTYRNWVLFWSATASGSVWYNTECIGNYRPWDKQPFNWYMSKFIIENKVRIAQEVVDYYDLTKWDYWVI